MADPTGPHRVLLTETTSVSARQTLTVLGGLGYRVGVLDGGGLSFTRGSRWVARRHRVPAFAAGPVRWLDAAEAVLREHRYDVLLPTHEQLVALAWCPERFTTLVPGLAVPPFAAVRQVQDKAVATALLTELGLTQPETVVTAPAELTEHRGLLPAYVKLPVATASRGVWPVRDEDELAGVARLPAVAGADRVLVQRALDGPVAMAAAVFDRGRLVACHTLLRTREGVQGGAAAKQAADLPQVRAELAVLGRALAWHGPLSADFVLAGPDRRAFCIDLNPRLVEPVNAQLSGAGLVESWLRVSTGEPAPEVVAGATGTRTHALLMGLMGRAAAGRGRRGLLTELGRAATGRGWYASSTEELTPAADPWSWLPPAITAAVLLTRPAAWKALTGTGVPPHALTAAGWAELTGRRGSSTR